MVLFINDLKSLRITHIEYSTAVTLSEWSLTYKQHD